MVAGKVKAAMGFQKSPATPKPTTPRLHHRHSAPPPTTTTTPPYFPRSAPTVAELLKLVEELREKESRLRTELLENKILKETVAIVPFLEKEIAAKNEELKRSRRRILALEAENQVIKLEVEKLRSRKEDEVTAVEMKIKDMESEIEELKKAVAATEPSRPRRHSVGTGDSSSPAVASVDECYSSHRFQGLIEASSRSNLLRNLRKVSNPEETSNAKVEEKETESAIPTLKSGVPRVPRPPPTPTRSSSSTSTSSCSSYSSVSSSESQSVDKTLHQLPPPPPPPAPPAPSTSGASRPPPPPPPPPPSKCSKTNTAKVRRVPEVVEFYHSLMRRDSKRDSCGGGAPDPPATAANAKDMIGEIENRSAYLLAIKMDVETQGDFIRFLIKQVENAAFTSIEDVVAFVKWLDDELSFLVDERAVLKHFEWPEQKADAMREAAFGFSDLKKLELEASSFRDDPRQHCAPALKKMQALLDKLEHGVYNLSRVRDAAIKRYKGFRIPSEWMLDTGFVSQIKLASVKLAMKYMRRVSAELEAVGLEEQELVLQGVQFAFRVHQFAGGFDVETMRAFQELRDNARSCQLQSQKQNHNHQRLMCRSTSC